MKQEAREPSLLEDLFILFLFIVVIAIIITSPYLFYYFVQEVTLDKMGIVR